MPRLSIYASTSSDQRNCKASMPSHEAKNWHQSPGHGPARLVALACVLTLLLTACNRPISIPSPNNPLSTSEREALVAFYNAAGGQHWQINAGWLEGDPIGHEVTVPEGGTALLQPEAYWYGVQIGSLNRVTLSPSGSSTSYLERYVQALLLMNNGLTGEISPRLTGLDKLQFLGLQGNQLTGGIPSELGQMDGLLRVDLSGNLLTGEIPSALGNIRLLDSLNLANNDLTGEIPVELSDLGPQLKTLRLGGNQLTGEIPPQLSSIRDLVTLDLRNNNLTGHIPEELGGFRQLRRLYLGGNQFTGCIPSRLRRIPDNDFLLLDLPMCDTGALPGDGSRRTLVALYRSAGGDNWRESANWGNTNNIRWYGTSNRGARDPRVVTLLQLRDNNLTGEIPPELGSIGSLRALDLSENNLTGRIPPELGDLKGLVSLRLKGNQFTGCIPASLDSVPDTDLFKLDLAFCGDEALPPDETNPVLLALYDSTGGDTWNNSTRWLTDQPIGKWFGVSGGRLQGSEGPDLVMGLQLSENNLTGEIPPELGELAGMGTLNLSGNNLTGEIPAELGDITLLYHLDLSNNQLTGGLPPELGTLRDLQVLDLSNNQLFGAIPPELNHLSNGALRVLRLGGNQFTGCIPAGLRGVQYNDLRELSLAFCDNLTTGALRALFRTTGGDNWHNSHGWLSNRSLAGWFGVLGSSKFVSGIALPENNLAGEIPPELGNLDKLVSLELSGNSLTGEIPPELGDISWLNYLSLADNQLTGELPRELGNLDRLESLDLSGNNLTGEIPPELGQLYHQGLRVMRLGGNQFTGCIPASLRLLEDHDFKKLGLPFCVSKTTGPLQALYNATGGDKWHVNTGWWTNQSFGKWFGVTGGTKVVRKIQLPGNNLIGELPPELGSLDRLESLDLSGNNLTGEIPPSLGDLKFLAALDLSDNNLIGSIPAELGGKDTPGRLDLSDNHLTGPIPAELGGIDGPYHLDLANNQLTGPIPEEFVSTRALRYLDLSGNDLTGEIPPRLGQLGFEGMRVLRLSGNRFTGCIPEALRSVPDNDLANLGLPFCGT